MIKMFLKWWRELVIFDTEELTVYSFDYTPPLPKTTEEEEETETKGTMEVKDAAGFTL